MSAHTFSTDGPRARLTIARDLDWAGLPDMASVFGQLSTELSELTVDLSALERLDNAGLGILLMLRHKAAEHGVAVTVLAPSEAVARALAASRLDQVFRVERSEAGEGPDMVVEELPM